MTSDNATHVEGKLCVCVCVSLSLHCGVCVSLTLCIVVCVCVCVCVCVSQSELSSKNSTLPVLQLTSHTHIEGRGRGGGGGGAEILLVLLKSVSILPCKAQGKRQNANNLMQSTSNQSTSNQHTHIDQCSVGVLWSMKLTASQSLYSNYWRQVPVIIIMLYTVVQTLSRSRIGREDTDGGPFVVVQR